MAYDEDLADRVRTLLAGEGGVTERSMFGAQAFMVDGNLSVAAGDDGLLVRLTREQFAELERRDDVEAMSMGSRTSKTFLRVGVAALPDDDALAEWVGYGVAVARSLPAK